MHKIFNYMHKYTSLKKNYTKNEFLSCITNAYDV